MRIEVTPARQRRARLIHAGQRVVDSVRHLVALVFSVASVQLRCTDGTSCGVIDAAAEVPAADVRQPAAIKVTFSQQVLG